MALGRFVCDAGIVVGLAGQLHTVECSAHGQALLEPWLVLVCTHPASIPASKLLVVHLTFVGCIFAGDQ